MRKIVLFFLAVGFTVLITAPFAAAYIIQDLTANISCSNLCTSFWLDGQPPVPWAPPGWAQGHASFSQLGLPWTFSFTTALPTSWDWSGLFNYTAQFGRGGVFTMTGPYGLTFAGIVESGNAAEVGLGYEHISINFSGQWSNGWQATGSTFQSFSAGPPIWPPPYGLWTELHTQPTQPAVPEPGCLLLLSSGALAAWKYRTQLLS